MRLKKIFLMFIIVAAMIGLCNINVTEVDASSATTKTYTLDSDGRLVTTQDAYLPKYTFTSLGLSDPSDLAIDSQGNIYISDYGNSRIVVLDSATGTVITTLTEDYDSQTYKPMGLYVDDEDQLYVCYPANEAVFMYDSMENGFTLLKQYNNPDSVLFDNRDFNPQKIAVDTGGNLYIIGEGVNEGIIQLSVEGEFLGYFATNTVSLSILEQLQYFFYTDEQIALLPSNTPPVFSSIYADSRGLIYTTTTNQDEYTWVKKHNTAGTNMFTKYDLVGTTDMLDIWVDINENVYALSKSGEVYVYTSQGEFIYKFGGGGTSSSPDIAGVFKSCSALLVDYDLNIWVLDTEQEILQTFEPTDYATTIYSALNAYFDSDYDGAIELWNEVLELNQMSNLAHNNLGLNYLYSQQYEDAMEHLKIANNKSDYSTAYWEVRNIWIQNNLTAAVMLLFGLAVVWFIVSKFNKKYQFLAPVVEVKNRVRNNKVVSDYLYMFTICRHPEDGYYYLKTKRNGSHLGALLILLTMFITYIIYLTCQGFIYQYQEVNEIDFFSVVLGFYLIIFVFIICNYLVTSIADGKGNVIDIFELLMYSLAPLIVGMLSIVLLSHVVTEGESFILDVIMWVTVAWTVFTALKGMQEIQGYSLGELFKSLILTVVFIMIIIIVLLIIFVLSQDLFSFLELIIKELIR